MSNINYVYEPAQMEKSMLISLLILCVLMLLYYTFIFIFTKRITCVNEIVVKFCMFIILSVPICNIGIQGVSAGWLEDAAYGINDIADLALKILIVNGFKKIMSNKNKWFTKDVINNVDGSNDITRIDARNKGSGKYNSSNEKVTTGTYNDIAIETVKSMNLGNEFLNMRLKQKQMKKFVPKDLINVSIYDEETYHKKNDSFNRYEVIELCISEFAKTREEYVSALKWIRDDDPITYYNENIRLPKEQFRRRSMVTLSVSAGNTNFSNINDAINKVEDAIDDDDDYDMRTTKSHRIADWFRKHPNHPDNPNNKNQPDNVNPDRSDGPDRTPQRPHRPFPDITVRFVTHEHYDIVSQGGYVAKAGEGIPEIIRPDILTMDFKKSRTACVFNAYLMAWMYFTDDIDLEGNTLTGISIFNNIHEWHEYNYYYQNMVMPVLRKRKIASQWSTDDSSRLLDFVGVDIKVLQYFEGNDTSEKALSRLIASDFDRSNNTVHIYITKNGHASMLMHVAHINSYWKEIVETKLRFTYRHKINKPKPLSRKQSTPFKYVNTGDTESMLRWVTSSIQENIPMVFCLKLWNQQYVFKGKSCIKDAINFLCNIDKKQVKENSDNNKAQLEIWFHNLPYDISLMFLQLIKHSRPELVNPIKPLSSGNRIISLQAHLKNGVTLVLRDSFKHCPTSLKSWARDVFPDQPDKWKGEYNVLQAKTVEQITSDECVKYCLRDCETLEAVLRELELTSIVECGINQLSMQTLTSYSKADFFYNHYDDETYPIHVPTTALDNFIRNSYTGGLTMMFRRGITRGKIIDPDINSHYPTVLTGDVPYGIFNKANIIDLQKLQDQKSIYNYLKANTGFYKCNVTVPKLESVKPWLSFKTVNGLEVPYCKRKHGTWTSLRLLEAMDRGTIVNTVIQGYQCKTGKVFKSFIEHHYKARLSATSNVIKTMHKNIMNTLYGAMGFRHRGRKQSVVYGNAFSNQMMNNDHIGLSRGTILPVQGGQMYIGEETVDVHNENCHVGIASWVTDRAQAKLLSLREIVDSIDGYKCIYGDTDSLKILCPSHLTSKSMLHPNILELLDDRELGKMKIESMVKYSPSYLETFQQLNGENAKPIDCNENFINEFCALAPKQYYQIDSNMMVKVHIKSMKINMLGYNYITEEDTLNDYQKNIAAIMLMRMSFEDSKPFTIIQRKMFVSTMQNFLQIGTHNKLVELNISGICRKVNIGEDGWCIPLNHEEWLDDPPEYNDDDPFDIDDYLNEIDTTDNNDEEEKYYSEDTG
jgi:hypothetical protein